MAADDLSEAVPFPARKAMQDALWNDCILSNNEWTTWTDSITLAEVAAAALTKAGFAVVASNDTRAHAYKRAQELEAEVRRLKAERWKD